MICMIKAIPKSNALMSIDTQNIYRHSKLHMFQESIDFMATYCISKKRLDDSFLAFGFTAIIIIAIFFESLS